MIIRETTRITARIASIVALLTAGVVATLLKAPPERELTSLSQNSALDPVSSAAASFVSTGKRAPASAMPQFDSVALADSGAHQAVDLQLPCFGRTAFSNSVTQVRLIGRTCLTGRDRSHKVTAIEIANLTNGFSATVFRSDDRAPTSASAAARSNTFSTDYISLHSGSNRLHVALTLDDGQIRERDFVIDRTSAAE